MIMSERAKIVCGYAMAGLIGLLDDDELSAAIAAMERATMWLDDEAAAGIYGAHERAIFVPAEAAG